MNIMITGVMQAELPVEHSEKEILLQFCLQC